MLNGDAPTTARIEQDSSNFDFENSRGNAPTLDSAQEDNLKEMAKNMDDTE